MKTTPGDHARALLQAQEFTDIAPDGLGGYPSLGRAYIELREWMYAHLGGEDPVDLDFSTHAGPRSEDETTPTKETDRERMLAEVDDPHIKLLRAVDADKYAEALKEIVRLRETTKAPELPEAPVVHVLVGRAALCGFMAGSAAIDWPEGHSWCYVEQAPTASNCAACLVEGLSRVPTSEVTERAQPATSEKESS